MTKYTEDDIRAAFNSVNTDIYFFNSKGKDLVLGAVITALKRPKWQPAIGEVCVWPPGFDHQYAAFYDQAYASKPTRPLTQTEAGPWGEAVGVVIDVLEDIAAESEMKIPTTYSVMAAKALTKIKSILPEGET